MDAIAIYNTTALDAAGSLSFSLFDSFLEYIDRGEKTTRTYITNLRQFAAFLKYRAITRPDRRDIIAYRDYLAAEHDAIKLDNTSFTGWSYRTTPTGERITLKCRPATIAGYLRCVCQFFRWTAAEGLYPNIAENIHAPKVEIGHKKDFLTAQDVLAIENNIAAAGQAKIEAAATKEKDTAGRIERATEQDLRLKAIYLLAVNAGLRTIELSRANVKDLEIKKGQGVLYLWRKGHSDADLKKALAPDVLAAIQEYLDSRKDKYTGNSPLFVSTGNRAGGKRIAATTISQMLKKAMQAAGYNSERLTAHSLRHTTAQNVLCITGENIHKTQHYLDHKSPVTTQAYLHETEAQQAEEQALANNLYNFYHGNTQKADMSRLESILGIMTKEQLEQLTNIAAAMTR